MTKVYDWTGPTGVQFRDIEEPSGTYYRDTTPRPVIDALEAARQNRARVRLFYGDQTGKDWGEEYDTTGTIGRSSGDLKAPILLNNSRSSGGGAILTDNIVRIIANGREVYRHPSYHQPTYAIHPSDEPGYAVQVEADGHPVARFRKEQSAFNYVAFMRGERMSK